MVGYETKVYDSIGNSHDRKNLYLKEVAELQEKYEETKDINYKNKLKELVSNKNSNKYIIELNKAKEEEKEFLKGLKTLAEKHKKDNDNILPKSLLKLDVEFRLAIEKIEFYKKYVDLSYDFELEYKSNKILVEQLPLIIREYNNLNKDIRFINEELKNIDKNQENIVKKEIEEYIEDRKKLLEEQKLQLKDKKNKGIISKKAYKNEVKQYKYKFKDDIETKSFESKEKYYINLKKSIEFIFKDGIKTRKKILNADISDLRRKTPVEVENKDTWKAIVTIPIPGLGQILNKQYMKSLFFLIGSLFIYSVAIPYNLGFGNYQGTGISGLLSLAEGGARLDKSLIFMIEGIIAFVLLVFAVLILILSFKDVHGVLKNKFKGVRENNWFETKDNIENNGFPYIVSIPALILIVFIVIVPIATALLLSFTNMDPDHQSKFSWIGFKNYSMLLKGEGMAGSVFWKILVWTLIWTFGATTLSIFIGFALALLAHNERIRGKVVFRTIFLLPWAVPAFITIMFFSIMASPGGAITEILSGIFGTDVLIKNSTVLTRIALICLQGWLGSSYIFLLATGVLQGIPGDLYEAADIDGATALQRLTKITIPLVLFQTAPLLVSQYTFNFNNFSIIYLFNQGGPFNPTNYGNLAGSSDILISYIYNLTMVNGYQAVGAAITIFISIGLMIFTFIGYRNSKAFKEDI
ncbi:ABC transporter permease subunit [Miniphocaeibacter halophilus]|uniref:ABC transporter permease subunit n=1 Tax=Miniphocaeibacter halophilus TaxID=2931922 RepID=A0AC61MNT2_9FIRM|nr:ABC transporter permease subunit [Miniphocaeibacter halophilus]QQK07177.1 ABC transporter permease subunit [Miniphocaeibacter halophilus]